MFYNIYPRFVTVVFRERIVKFMRDKAADFQDFIQFEKSDVKEFLRSGQSDLRSFIETNKSELKRSLIIITQSILKS